MAWRPSCVSSESGVSGGPAVLALPPIGADFPSPGMLSKKHSVNGATGSSGLVSPLGNDTGQGWECPGLSFSCHLFEHP